MSSRRASQREQTKAARLLAATRAATKNPARFARGAARLPLEQQAAARIAALPAVELVDLTNGPGEFSVSLADRPTRHGWSLGAAEQLFLQIVVAAREACTAFEIGTFNGGTTRVLAEALPEDGRVWTLDLPPDQFDATQAPEGFSGSQVGTAYRESSSAHKITQIMADSLTYDFGPHAASADVVLVDGGHEYRHGFSDTKAALSIVRDGGLILWDDFEPYWHGLVAGICDAMDGRRLGRLAGTSYAVYVNTSA